MMPMGLFVAFNEDKSGPREEVGACRCRPVNPVPSTPSLDHSPGRSPLSPVEMNQCMSAWRVTHTPGAGWRSRRPLLTLQQCPNLQAEF